MPIMPHFEKFDLLSLCDPNISFSSTAASTPTKIIAKTKLNLN
jgi:hypothetical protein